MSTLPRFSHDHSILSEFRFENNWRSDWTPVSVLKNDMGGGGGLDIDTYFNCLSLVGSLYCIG